MPFHIVKMALPEVGILPVAILRGRWLHSHASANLPGSPSPSPALHNYHDPPHQPTPPQPPPPRQQKQQNHLLRKNGMTDTTRYANHLMSQ